MSAPDGYVDAVRDLEATPITCEVSFVVTSEADLLHVLRKLTVTTRDAGLVAGDDVVLRDINGNRVGAARVSAAS